MRIRCFAAVLCAAAALGCGDDDRPSADRDAGPPPDTGTTLPRDAGPGPVTADTETMARAAVLVRSCIGAFAGQPVGSATSILMQIYGTIGPRTEIARLIRDQAECLATAGTGCEAISTCLGVEFPATPDCAPGCDGETAVFCEGGHARWRCSSVGLRCDAASGTCVAPVPCTEAACMEERPIGCTDTVSDPRDVCTEYGLTCAVTDGMAGCVATGEACTTGGDGFDVRWFYDPTTGQSPATACLDADTLTTCVAGARHDLPCAQIADGMRCRMTSDVTPSFFCGLGNTCNPFTAAGELCTGDAVPVCNAGRPQNVDCIALGFTRCMLGRCE